MIETPEITRCVAIDTAVIHLTVTPLEMRKVVGPGLGELLAAVKAQGIGAAGPWFIQQLRMPTDTYDFEISVPVRKGVVAVGRVKPSRLPATRVARTVHHGGYEGLFAAWAEFDAWVQAQGLQPAPNMWDVYVVGPETSPDPSTWRTQLNRPVLG
jgi:effector-binding domain-containing protein